ncbi:hypothetical protein QQS21_012525 [Conoideocrella luteorostrata]|uniref:Uncharacterized protein n=1 Tax=Conoideocrella luteorostrata TaxID=1105319 RepID=A0AAJ0FSD7_9HYPO|nr:hypothetical protein QQS21_012525 [Conoideocrella luteorostrata]
MATHATANGGGHDGVRKNGYASAPVPCRPQPGSPTLTNPDMILPDYNEPEPLNDRSHSPPSASAIWSNSQPTNAFHDFSSAGYLSGPLPLATPIIYGNGTMLSDIGEVTEAESIIGPQFSRTSSRPSSTGAGTGGSGTPLRSSPTMGSKTLKKRPRIITKPERRLSIESNSTIQTIDGPEGSFDDFDDSVSVDDSNFQGDDEESLASEFVDESSHQSRRTATLPSGQGLNEDRFSTNSLSTRAEQILANAKRRLTTMEGNLNRARTFSYSSVSDGSTPSPVTRPNVSIRDKMQPTTSSHARNVSENGVHGAARTAMLPQRSASALGAAGGYRQYLPLSRSADVLGAKTSAGSLRSPLYSIDSTLESLDEDEDAQDENQSRSSSRLQNIASPTFGSFTDAGMTRSSSAAQMRDLHDQMQGLKGKISSLKEQAKQDSMKRRSLQSLRALSPFTNAAWDQAGASPKSAASSDYGSPVLVNSINGTFPDQEKDKSRISGHGERQLPIEDGQEPGAHQLREVPESQDSETSRMTQRSNDISGEYQGGLRRHPSDEEDLARENEDLEVDDSNQEGDAGFEDSVSESGESLYHDTQQEPTDISHEDREDAFDYEHFFLHSAMGTLSRQRIGRSGSISSEDSDDSVETTRGPTTSYARRPSIDTMTSVDTFATAREGMESRNSTVQSSEMSDGFVTPTPHYEDDSSSTTTKRSTIGGLSQDSGSGSGRSSGSGSNSASGSGSGSGSDSAGYYQQHARHNSVIHRPTSLSTESTLHRPSVSSFESTGTNRSFPLVNKVRLSGGALTPSGSPDNQLKQVADSLMHETVSICDRDSAGSGPQSPAIQTLSREDQMLVEQVVASLGRCVLGLSEAARQGTGNQNQYRQRIEAARKLLENVSDKRTSFNL